MSKDSDNSNPELPSRADRPSHPRINPIGDQVNPQTQVPRFRDPQPPPPDPSPNDSGSGDAED